MIFFSRSKILLNVNFSLWVVLLVCNNLIIDTSFSETCVRIRYRYKSNRDGMGGLTGGQSRVLEDVVLACAGAYMLLRSFTQATSHTVIHDSVVLVVAPFLLQVVSSRENHRLSR